MPRSRAEPLASADDLRERLRGSRVWVLDNDAAICAGMRTLLEAWGCRVVTALSEEDLARQVDNYHAEADLLIVDYHLDDQRNGVDAVAAINARRGSPLPALMITANYSNELKQQVRELGHTLMQAGAADEAEDRALPLAGARSLGLIQAPSRAARPRRGARIRAIPPSTARVAGGNRGRAARRAAGRRRGRRAPAR